MTITQNAQIVCGYEAIIGAQKIQLSMTIPLEEEIQEEKAILLRQLEKQSLQVK
eukprot:CAMPEP_0176419122 /NCGR_PEP_ID=MMETSP0127-20121128/7864_1 /TAXON_ID=938130 /ORGANISM="Platyophrya macrostoma, Strain WH" /LENGTH=53 /DNA_ID=CAMNT_0017799549 /DNA_START=293 /DNA_END=454 /DNA_ORIENTATION=+